MASLSVHAVEPSDERGQATAACRILNAWHADRPEPGEWNLHLVCWTPSDRELPANYQARLTRIMRHIQDFYAGEMQRLGFGDRSTRSVADRSVSRTAEIAAVECSGRSSTCGWRAA
jgi:hypothetical protein